MKDIFKKIRNIFRLRTIRNSFAGSDISRLYSKWTTTNTSGDTELRLGLKTLRARARQLARDNDYVKKYLRMVVVNVLGANGINFQSKVKTVSGKKPDKKANERLEKAFREWGNRSNFPEVTGKLSWRGIQRVILRSVARDGEVLIRKVRNFKNKAKYSLQLIEADLLDENLNKVLSQHEGGGLNQGNEIRMGVEFNEWKKPVAYWLLTKHPGDSYYRLIGNQKYNRIPVEEIIHIFDPDRVNDSRGYTWLHTAMARLRMLGKYEEAELTAARVAAAKMLFYTSKDGTPPVYDGKDDKGNFLKDVDPGAAEVLPEGYTIETFDPTHPQGNFPPFIKQMLRGVASGLNVSYASLASDLESVNFSSIRSGTLEERDNWKSLQAWFIEDCCQEVYDGFLEMYLLTKDSPYNAMQFDRLNNTKWTGRAWAWVDPLKDAKANREALEQKTTTYTELFAEKGQDLEEQLDTMVVEKEMFEDRGLEYGVTKSPTLAKEGDEIIKEDEETEKELEETQSTKPPNGDARSLQ